MFADVRLTKIRAVVLDLDGLMLDTEPLYKAAWQEAAGQLGFIVDDARYATLIGRPADESEAELTNWFGPDFPIAQFRARWPEVWSRAVVSGGIPCKRGLHALLDWLAARRLATAIATSSEAGYAQASLHAAGLGDCFSILVTRDEVARGKPAPDLYLEAARRLGRSPAECLALEDSDVGVLAATSAGMLTVCIPDQKMPSAEASAAALHVLDSLDAVRELLARGVS
jgi:beta-phosphoglucomutase-like phosphatase (HAD superfamily)